MGKRTPTDEQIVALNRLRDDSTSEAAVQALRAALKSRSSRVVAKAAEIAGESGNEDLVPQLLDTYQRLLVDPQKKDPGCTGKTAIAGALVRLDCHDLDFYRTGIRYTQYEPVWGGEEDTAAELRAICAAGMVTCASILEALNCFAELLADPYKTARIGAARAIGGLGHPEGAPLLKLKLLVGDRDAEVVGECCTSLLRLAPDDGLRTVCPLLESADLDVRVQAAVALGESRNPQALEPLQECWQSQWDASVRRIVLTSIGLLRAKEADEFLLELIRSQDETAAADAIAALAPFRHLEGLQDKIESAVAESGNPRLRRLLDED